MKISITLSHACAMFFEFVVLQVARMSRRCHSWTICIGTMRRALMHYKRKWHKEGWLKEGQVLELVLEP